MYNFKYILISVAILLLATGCDNKDNELMYYGIGLSQADAFVFDAVQEGYTAIPEALSVTVYNTGNQPTGRLTIVLSGKDANNFIVSTDNLDLEVEGTAIFTIQPKSGLPAGKYEATITVSGRDDITAQVFDVSFIVKGIELSISLSQTETYSFDAEKEGYSIPPTALAVTVTNTGNYQTGTLNVTLSGTGMNNFTVSPKSFSIDIDQTATFTVQPKNNLTVGNHTATVTVSGGSGAISQTFDVIFNVMPNAVLTDITITPPSKMVYAIGEPLDFTGMALTAIYSDNTSMPIDVTAANISYDFSVAGIRTVDVTLDDITRSFEITVQTLLERISEISGTKATLILFADETLAPLRLANNTNLTLIGDSGERIIRLTSNGCLFTLPATTSLTLENNITLKGITKGVDGASSDNNNSVIAVQGGTFTMKNGSKITGNTIGAGTGNSMAAGVKLNAAGATFSIQGGSITGNAMYGTGANSVGAIWIASGTADNPCSFTMSGGIISNNTATGSSISCGGVFLARNNTVFTKTGGIIYGGSATDGNANTGLGTATNKANAVLWENGWKKVNGDATHNMSNVDNIGWD